MEESSCFPAAEWKAGAGVRHGSLSRTAARYGHDERAYCPRGRGTASPRHGWLLECLRIYI